MTLANKRLVFITGVEGSGTTMLSQWLGGPAFAACLTKGTSSPAYVRESDEVNALSEKLWRQASRPTGDERSRIVAQIRAVPIGDDISHVVWKRSTPFISPDYMPVLEDLPLLAERCALVVMKRSPVACAISILRRGMVQTHDDACVRVRAAAAHLSAQWEKVASVPRLVITYETVIAHPAETARQLECWLDYPAGSLSERSAAIGGPTETARQMREDQGAALSPSLADLQYAY